MRSSLLANRSRERPLLNPPLSRNGVLDTTTRHWMMARGRTDESLTAKGDSVTSQDMLLIERAIDGVTEAQEIVRILISRGTLPVTWQEIESVLDDIRSELCRMELELRETSDTINGRILGA